VILEQHYREDPDALLGGLAYSEMHQAVPELISDIADGATRIKNIVGNLKDFARPGGAAEISDVDLNIAVARAVRLLRHFIQKKTRHFHSEYAEDLPTIKGDYQKIEQIIVNLVMNALEALPNIDCAVTVSTQRNDTGTHLEVRIIDEGIGIPREDLDKLFDAFFTTKQAKGGTGLGLEISAMLVREHGGTISFDSELGKGTEVLIRFPV
jgi:signal transduction histidine kinase